MRKNFGAKPFVYPMPVFIIGSYDEANVPNAMNAAWGCICDYDKVAVCLAQEHKTTENILAKKAFTVSMADAANVISADYVGIVSANDVPNKLEICGWHTVKSDFVDAPVIEELPMTLECELVSFDTETDIMIGRIVNVSADESILDESGKIAPAKLNPITFDPVHNDYIALGEKVGNAFRDGLALKK